MPRTLAPKSACLQCPLDMITSHPTCRGHGCSHGLTRLRTFPCRRPDDAAAGLSSAAAGQRAPLNGEAEAASEPFCSGR